MKKNQVLTVATLVARHTNDVMMTSMVGSGGACVWQEPGIFNQAVGFEFVRLAGMYLQSQ
jgi:hypothetical protein